MAKNLKKGFTPGGVPVKKFHSVLDKVVLQFSATGNCYHGTVKRCLWTSDGKEVVYKIRLLDGSEHWIEQKHVKRDLKPATHFSGSFPTIDV